MENTENLGSAQRGIMKVNEVEKREKLYKEIPIWRKRHSILVQ